MLAHHTQQGMPMQPPRGPPMPTNPEAQKVIDKVIEYLMRTPEFEAKLREKEQGNPKFSFLFGGENSDYYNWKTYCARNPGAEQAFYAQQNYGQHHGYQPNFNPQNYHQQYQQQQQQVPLSEEFPTTLNTHELAELNQLLNTLSSSKESINSGKNWITQHRKHAPSIIEHIKQKISTFENSQKNSTSENSQKTLLVVYLINEVLINAAKVKEERQTINDAFVPRLGFIMNVAYHQAADKREKLDKVLAIWSKRAVFDENILKTIENEMRDPNVLPRFRQQEMQKQQYPPQGWHPQQQQFPPNYPPNGQFGMTQPPMGFGMVTPHLLPQQPPVYHPSLENVPMGVLVTQIRKQNLNPPSQSPYSPLSLSLLKLPPNIAPPDAHNPALVSRLEEMFLSIEKIKKESGRDREVQESGFNKIDSNENNNNNNNNTVNDEEDLDGEEIDDTVMQEIQTKEKEQSDRERAAHIAEVEQVMGIKQDGSAAAHSYNNRT